MKKTSFYEKYGKRVFDLTLALVTLVVLSPTILVALCVVATDGGNPVFKQERVGLYGKPFTIYKIRTMREGSEKDSAITKNRDERITKVGLFLRKFRIDEFLQLLNVIKGEMSFVGPRPELPEFVNGYTEEQRRVLNVRPGITEFSSIEFRNESELLKDSLNPSEDYRKDILPRKLQVSLNYTENVSFENDMKIMFSTVKAVMGG